MTKLDCIQSLTIGINRTAFWREKMAEKYPLDPRNSRAAARLTEIAVSVKDLSDDLVAHVDHRRAALDAAGLRADGR
jgi:hypothetical protein